MATGPELDESDDDDRPLVGRLLIPVVALAGYALVGLVVVAGLTWLAIALM